MSWSKILTVLFGIGIAGSAVVSPVEANEEKFSQQFTISQNYDYGNSIDNTESTDNIRNIVGLTGLAVGTGVVGYHLTRAYRPSLANSLPIVNNRNSDLLSRVNPKLRRELLRLVHNQATASRLLSGTLTSHPGRNPNWLAEKVIYDLKRDR